MEERVERFLNVLSDRLYYHEAFRKLYVMWHAAAFDQLFDVAQAYNDHTKKLMFLHGLGMVVV